MTCLKRTILFVLLVAVHPDLGAAQSPDVLADLEAAQPSWLYPADACPADIMSDDDVDVLYFGDRCIDALDSCLGKCEAGDANACYALALAAQTLERELVSQALFLRACSLGLVSGCTNRAAGMPQQAQACSIRTYEKACKLDDPWACTMLGFHLFHGDGVAKDHARARGVLAKSCRYGDEDEACRSAKELLEKIKAAE